MSENLIVGIDMSKKDFTAASRVGQAEVELGKFTNDEAGFAALAEAAQAECRRQGLSQIQLILESRPEGTRGYEAALKVYAYGQGWVLSMRGAPWAPHRVRQWAIGVGYRVKTDRVDARILAHYGVERQPPLRPQLAAEVEELDSLLKRQQDLEQALHKEKNRLSEMGAPRGSPPGLAPAVVDSFKQVIAALESALADIETVIDELCQTHEPFQQNMKRLLALPGIGPKVVLPLMVKLFQFQNMAGNDAEANALVAFSGFDPQPFESGGCPLGAVRKQAGISKMGDSELRRLLYMGALGGVGGNNSLKYFYQRLVGRGKAKKVALVAAARKLLVWAWTIFSRQIDWDPNFNKTGA